MLLKLTFDRTNNNFDDEYENFTSSPNGTFTSSLNSIMFKRRPLDTTDSITFFLYVDNNIVNKYYCGVGDCLHQLRSITSLTYEVIDIDITTEEIHAKATANWDAYVDELFGKYST